MEKHSNDLTKSYKPIKRQYFTFGKDNCLVHHPTTQRKTNSPNAVFCTTNPFSTQSQTNKTCHKKLKSTFLVPKKQETFITHTDAIKQDAISKITKNLKQPQTVSDSDLSSIIVRGTSLKLEPKKHFQISTCCASGYCPSIKRCKMCGKVMLNIQSSTSSISKNYSSNGSCSECLDKKSRSFKENVENKLHQHNPIIKRCIMCSKLFKKPSSSMSCEKCPSVRTQGHERGSVNATKDTYLKTNPEKFVKNVMSSQLRDDYIDTFAKYKASKNTKCNKLPSRSNDAIEDLLQVRGLSSKQQHTTKRNIPSKSVFAEKPSRPTQTKSSAETNQLATKTKSTSSKANIYNEQCKKTNDGSAKVSKKPTYAKSFKSNLATKCKSLPDKPISEIYISTERYEHDDTATNQTPAEDMPLQTRSLPERIQATTTRKSKNINLATESNSLPDEPIPENFHSAEHYEHTNKKPSVTNSNMAVLTSSLPERIQLTISRTSKNINLATECISLPEEPPPEICQDAKHYEHTNTANKKSSAKCSNMPVLTSSLPEERQITTYKNDTSVLPSKSYLPSEQCKNTNMDHEASVADKSSIFIQTNSLSTTNLDTTISGISSESVSSEEYLPREQTEDSGMDQRKESIERSNCLLQNNPLSETSQRKTESDPKNVLNKQSKNIDQTSQEDSAEIPILTKSLQLDQDFLSKIADLVLPHKKEENISPTPVIQNVTFNNYYYLTGSDLKKKLLNSSVAYTNHPPSSAKHSSSESSIVSSETEDSLEIDKIQDRQNGSNNIFGSEYDKISFLKDAHSALENDPCSAIGRCDLLTNLYHNGRLEERFQNLNLCAVKELQTCNPVGQALYGIKTTNPYIEKSLKIFEEMDNIRNEPINPEKILEELKQNPQLMRAINQMAAKKLNYPRKATVFKDFKN